MISWDFVDAVYREHYRNLFNGFLKWLATIITLAGAVLTSCNLFPYNVYVFNVGCFVWMLWGWRIREYSIVAVNTGLLIIYLFGALKWVS
jgi:hypothetical protein